MRLRAFGAPPKLLAAYGSLQLRERLGDGQVIHGIGQLYALLRRTRQKVAARSIRPRGGRVELRVTQLEARGFHQGEAEKAVSV